ncbi:TetR/AcrR family transcriptional regulator [Actinokineospora sp. UTMC 2448]|uniref:TetR/AcrR family transcriptional regulator n=1 Tax=Actinokineospora sp. UTMC 2448 TaxID=2268449 RepID=UPI002164306D|nr:TetR/AcrR family transcriptional regulator [Actinokineospora sp. UTMC 2448]UVS78608.1 Toluene efflux pump ttgABC operon repressor [Actinokineospora sp. UTMC 2448]
MNPSEATDDERPARITPRSRRGIRTKQALIAAAREVFERDGYVEARITDITKAAGVASGSFYTYFNDKEEIFAALVEVVQEEMLHPHLRERTGESDPRALIDAANRDYLQAYKRNSRLMALFEQVAQINEKFSELRRERAVAFGKRNAKMISDLQEQGNADPELDPFVTALALSAMVSRMAYIVYVARIPIGFEKLVGTVNRIWFNALRIDS